MTKIKDTDYLALSSRIKAMETRLLSQSRMEQILEARSDEEAAKLLQECGYGELTSDRPEELDRVLAASREAMLADLSAAAPDPRYIEIFKMKYDYHNAKVLLKAQARGVDPASMLSDMGRVDVEKLREAVENAHWTELPDCLGQAIAQAREVLDTTGDPQLSDVTLDRWYYREMLETAQATGSDFLLGYVRAVIDAANLRTLVRILRMGKGAGFLRSALIEGGSVSVSALLAVGSAGGSGLAELYASTSMQEAAESGAAALSGGTLTAFEKLCDDAVERYLAGAKYVAFGEAPLVGYLAAKETEYHQSPHHAHRPHGRAWRRRPSGKGCVRLCIRIAVWEIRPSVLGFRALGLDTYAADTAEEAQEHPPPSGQGGLRRDLPDRAAGRRDAGGDRPL